MYSLGFCRNLNTYVLWNKKSRILLMNLQTRHKLEYLIRQSSCPLLIPSTRSFHSLQASPTHLWSSHPFTPLQSHYSPQTVTPTTSLTRRRKPTHTPTHFATHFLHLKKTNNVRARKIEKQTPHTISITESPYLPRKRRKKKNGNQQQAKLETMKAGRTNAAAPAAAASPGEGHTPKRINKRRS